MKQIALKLIDSVTARFFPEGVGERTSTFIRGVSWTMSSAFIARFLSGVSTLFIARWLGPKEFGEANLSFAATLWIQVPLYIGLPLALVHYMSKNSHEKEKWLSEGLGLMTLTMAVTFGVAYLFRPQWSHVFGIEPHYFLLAIVWCACAWPFAVARTVLNAVERFAFRSWMEIIYAVMYPLTFILLALQGYRSSGYVMALALPYALLGIISFVYLRPPLKGMFAFTDRSRKMLVYALLGAMGSASAALFEASARLIANRVLSVEEVGVIAAYQSASTQMAVFLLTAFAQVFFPIASRTPDKQTLFKKLNQWLWPYLPALVVIFCAGVAAYLLLLGKNFPFLPLAVFVFGLAAAMTLINGIINWFVLTYGWRGILTQAVVGIGTGLLNLLFCQIAIPRYQLLGAGVANLIAATISAALLCLPQLHTWLNRGREQKA